MIKWKKLKSSKKLRHKVFRSYGKREIKEALTEYYDDLFFLESWFRCKDLGILYGALWGEIHKVDANL